MSVTENDVSCRHVKRASRVYIKQVAKFLGDGAGDPCRGVSHLACDGGESAKSSIEASKSLAHFIGVIGGIVRVSPLKRVGVEALHGARNAASKWRWRLTGARLKRW